MGKEINDLRISTLEEVVDVISKTEVTIPARFRGDKRRVSDFLDGVNSECNEICKKLYRMINR